MHTYPKKTAIPHASRFALVVALCAATLVPSTLTAAPPQGSDDTSSRIDPRMLQAMTRDLGLDANRVARYLHMENAAIAGIPVAKQRLGAAYAGSWIEQDSDGDFRLVIAATDPKAAEQAHALGVESRIVSRSLAELETDKRLLDRIGRQHKPNAGIHSWYIDVKTNQVVIEAAPQARHAAFDFAARSGIDLSAVRFEESHGVPQTMQIVGGERYNLPNEECSIGFPVRQGDIRGFTTAGHCGGVGTIATGTNGIVQGSVAGSIFPGNDMAWVRITNIRHWPLRAWVTDYAGGTVPIIGSAVAPVGAAVCRSGATTGFRCGTITATDATVNYLQGTVVGLTRSSACADSGDSGGAFITAGGQAQGMVSGGQLNCTSNAAVTWFQPLQPVLDRYALTLFTGTTPSPPVIAQFVCPYFPDSGIDRIACFITYLADPPANVTWSGGNGGSVYTSSGFSEFITGCSSGQTFRVGVTVTNAGGSTSALSPPLTCNSGPIP